MSAQKQVVVSGAFDDIKSRDLRFLEESAKLGELTVLLWPDEMLQKLTGKAPKFSLAERRYFLNAVRYVSRVIDADSAASFDTLPKNFKADLWADVSATANAAREKFAAENKIARRIFSADDLKGFPEPSPMPSAPGRKKIVATGCYDWFHSGHVRFTEEASAYGDLYICLGSDANVRLLKGEGHPLFSQAERSFVVGSFRSVTRCLVSSGKGWLEGQTSWAT